jgi:FMN-dependent NADH-azoreductase
LTASPRAESACRELGDFIVTHLDAGQVIRRDLAANPPPLVDAAFSVAILGPPDPSAPALAESEALIGELEAADSVVIATPMHNFTVPAVLKAWVDQVVRIHRTFASTPAGKRGLLADRPVFVAVASGGWHTGPSPVGTPPQPDFLTPYLRTVLATIGIETVRFFYLEGVTRGETIRAQALAAGRAAVAGCITEGAVGPIPRMVTV